ncbi:DUF192 domain-containing protein [Leptolyngbya ohadii]|uniref:DUF192 domain-containing protein n=1 Tax=Leptolyngbya ohadii TaxID=1962290 RepID=UPI000B59A150|nr:DUF192 domain-containing protein [Leptolyngbya ohadii]
MISFTPLAPLLHLSLGVLLLGCTPSPSTSVSPSSPQSAPVSQTSPAASPSASPSASPAVNPAITPPVANRPIVNPAAAQMLPITAEAIIGGQTINLEVARTPREQAMGLMFRPPLPDDRGMLFSFDVPRPLWFWMKNTPSPLDMVFMLNGEVKAIAPNSPPCTADPCPTYGTMADVNQVIELRAGRAAELGLEVGDRVEIRYLNQPR